MTPPTTFLTADEVAQLTGKSRRPAQIRALVGMGIEHRRRPDGSPAVLRAHVEEVLTGRPARKQARRTEPNWEAIPR